MKFGRTMTEIPWLVFAFVVSQPLRCRLAETEMSVGEICIRKIFVSPNLMRKSLIAMAAAAAAATAGTAEAVFYVCYWVLLPNAAPRVRVRRMSIGGRFSIE